MPGSVRSPTLLCVGLAGLATLACGGGGGPTDPGPDGGPPPLRVGEVALEELDGGRGEIDLAFPAASAEFVLILQSLTPNERSFTTRVSDPGESAAAAAGLDVAALESVSPETEIRRTDRRIMDRLSGRRAPRRSGLAPAQTLGSRRQFFVANSTSPAPRDPADFDEVDATVRFVGDDALVYVDDAAPDLLTDAMIEDLGRRYDEGIHDTNVDAFGSETDIDGNGRVIILLTPTVNGLTTQQNVDDGTRLVAFFFALDLLPDLGINPFANGVEMFYAVVPDPDRTFGPARFSIEEYVELMSTTFAHEHQHMINASRRIERGAPPEALWLDEGLSHFAEWLNGFFTQNRLRVALFLDDPTDTSLVFSQDNLPGRGAAYLFVQYLHDRLGTDAVRELVQTSRSNVLNVEAVAGRAFRDLFSEWAAALLLDGTGTGDPAFEIPALDLRGDYESLKQTDFGERLPNSFLDVTETTLPGGSVFVNQRGTTPAYVRVSASAEGERRVEIDGESAANLRVGVARTR